ncbi:MAG: SGNH/GDSL hydrolase family protein [Clostridia bacterium]|nr:SGNH/GDSL hydrolase family protein [Clostridia bacterium]
MEILLLGDSIRMYYQQKVIDLLGGGYHVSAPTENCRFAAYTLNSLRMWLPSFPKPDVIHWNNGLWDTAVLYQEDGCFTPLPEYIRSLERILRELQKTGARVIFATTTPCDPRKAALTTAMPPCHRNEDIRRYNEAAVELMRRERMEINDLYAVVNENIPAYVSEDMIHPTEEGKRVLAEAVVRKIREK